MKKITVTGVENVVGDTDPNPKLQTYELEGPEEMDASDGYHTFKDLYEHRIQLFITLCVLFQEKWEREHEGQILGHPVWRSKLHADGTMYEDWFIMGINKKKGEQITYHLPIDRWRDCEFAITLKNAPEWDGHTPENVLDRLYSLV